MHTDVQVTTAAMVAELPIGGPPRILVAEGAPCRVGFTPHHYGPSR